MTDKARQPARKPTSFKTLLRSRTGSPLLEIMELLRVHRVADTGQIIRAMGAPPKTTTDRLKRLLNNGMVHVHRVGVPAGSSPQAWWLSAAGSRELAASAAGISKDRGDSSLAHSLAITELWVCLLEHAEAAGMTLLDFKTDHAGWPSWSGQHRSGKLTPDAVIRLRLPDGGEAAVLVEVDLATETQTVLRAKVTDYLQYAADHGWVGKLPHCPPVLLLTTLPARNVTFLGKVAAMVAAARSRPNRDAELFTQMDFAPVRPVTPVVAGCALVHDPARAITEPVWRQHPDDDPVTLLQLLQPLAAEQAAYDAREAVEGPARRRRHDRRRAEKAVLELRERSRPGQTPTAAGDMFNYLTRDLAQLARAEPDLWDLLVDYGRLLQGDRGTANDHARADLTTAIYTGLDQRHRRLWLDHAAQVLDSDHAAVGDPHLVPLARQVAAGRLARDLTDLDAPAEAHTDIQNRLLATYTTDRGTALNTARDALGRRERRRFDELAFTTDYDHEHLKICRGCALLHPDPRRDRCEICDGELLDLDQRAEATGLQPHLTRIGERILDPMLPLARPDR